MGAWPPESRRPEPFLWLPGHNAPMGFRSCKAEGDMETWQWAIFALAGGVVFFVGRWLMKKGH